MNSFKIKDTDSSQLIVETDYYKWLQNKRPTDIHNINTKIEYLTEQGFVKGRDKLSESDLRSLQYSERFYFDLEIKPKL
jgi:hypothetical protein